VALKLYESLIRILSQIAKVHFSTNGGLVGVIANKKKQLIDKYRIVEKFAWAIPPRYTKVK